MQIDNSHITVWEDATTKRSQISFEYDANLSDAWVSLGRGANGDPVRLTNLAVPLNDADATNKSYVDALIRGLTIKAPVRLVSADNKPLSELVPGASVDGVQLRLNDRVLLTAQTNAVDNGIWIINASAPSRATDLAAGADASAVYAFVDEGTVYLDRSFICITDRVDVNNQPSAIVGTNALQWVQFGARSAAIAGRGLVTGAANEVDVNVDDSTLVINNDYVCIKNPDIKVKVERGLIRSTTNGTAVTDTTTDTADVSVLGRTVPLGSNVTVRPDFTVIPDLAAANTFTDANTFARTANATWTQVVGQEPVLGGSVVVSAGGLAVRQNIICANASVRDTTDSTSTSTGALVVDGGVGVAKDLQVGGAANVASTTQSTSTSSGALVVAGGAAVAANLYTGGDVHCLATTAATTWSATDPLAGALTVEGGAVVRGDIHAANAVVHSVTDATSKSTGALQVLGGLGVARALWCDTANCTNTADSSSTGTGSLVVAGGAGIASNLYVGQGAHITGDVYAANAHITGDVSTATAHVTDTTNSVSPATGALLVTGGVGVAKDVHAGGDVHCDSVVAAAWAAGTAPMTGALVVEGGAAVRSELQCATAHMRAATASTSATSGALVVDGGAGIAGALYVGGKAHVAGSVFCDDGASSVWTPGALVTDPPTLSGALQVAGGVAIAKELDALSLHAHSTTDASSTTTGAVLVDGGLGVAKTVYATAACIAGGTAATSQTSGALTVTGGVGVSGDIYCQSTYNMSDRRLKKNIQTLDGALEKVCAMQGCTFDWNERMAGLENTPCVGVIAQNVLEHAPLCVVRNPETDLCAVGTWQGLRKAGPSMPPVHQVGAIPDRVRQGTETKVRRPGGRGQRSSQRGSQARPQGVTLRLKQAISMQTSGFRDATRHRKIFSMFGVRNDRGAIGLQKAGEMFPAVNYAYVRPLDPAAPTRITVSPLGEPAGVQADGDIDLFAQASQYFGLLYGSNVFAAPVNTFRLRWLRHGRSANAIAGHCGPARARHVGPREKGRHPPASRGRGERPSATRCRIPVPAGRSASSRRHGHGRAQRLLARPARWDAVRGLQQPRRRAVGMRARAVRASGGV